VHFVGLYTIMLGSVHIVYGREISLLQITNPVFCTVTCNIIRKSEISLLYMMCTLPDMFLI